jgi:anti-sigma factor RsiW
MNDKPDDNDDVALLLPWYATGRLSGADRRRVELYLEEHPEERAHLAVVEEELAETERLNRALPGPSGMDNILAGIRSSENRRPVARTESGISRLLAKLGEWLTDLAPPVRGAAIAALLMLLAIQAGTIGALLRSPQEAEFRTAAGEEIVVATRPSLLVMFAPDAPAAEITALLEELGARIVDGPRAGGVYGLALAPEADYEAALAAVQARGDLVVFAAAGE